MSWSCFNHPFAIKWILIISWPPRRQYNTTRCCQMSTTWCWKKKTRILVSHMLFLMQYYKHSKKLYKNQINKWKISLIHNATIFIQSVVLCSFPEHLWAPSFPQSLKSCNIMVYHSTHILRHRARHLNLPAFLLLKSTYFIKNNILTSFSSGMIPHLCGNIRQ